MSEMMSVKPIGGYFGLGVDHAEDPYPRAVPVNFGRGGLELIIVARRYRKVWIPDYICPAVPRFLGKIGVPYETYAINLDLEPEALPCVGDLEAFLYVNYFGVKDAFCKKLEESQRNLILDLTQAFYYEPMKADGFNSARKFFGVPDGGFAFGRGLGDVVLPESVSYDKCEALLRRADGDVTGGYGVFKKGENAMDDVRVAKMSHLTTALIGASKIEEAGKQRVSNFKTLHADLSVTNELGLFADSQGDANGVPMVYPYLVRNGGKLRQRLIARQIYCPTYWTGLINPGATAGRLSKELVCIPIDQRYSHEDMIRVLEVVHEETV